MDVSARAPSKFAGDVVFDEFLLSVNDKQSQIVAASALPQLGLLEGHLQKWVLGHPELLGARA